MTDDPLKKHSLCTIHFDTAQNMLNFGVAFNEIQILFFHIFTLCSLTCPIVNVIINSKLRLFFINVQILLEKLKNAFHFPAVITLGRVTNLRNKPQVFA